LDDFLQLFTFAEMPENGPKSTFSKKKKHVTLALMVLFSLFHLLKLVQARKSFVQVY
jgi:hypothetical protein